MIPIRNIFQRNFTRNPYICISGNSFENAVCNNIGNFHSDLDLAMCPIFMVCILFHPKSTWWRHQMETCSALLALCAGNSPAPVNSLHKGQWRGALMFTLICAWINDWVNNREAGDLRRHRDHYDVIVMNPMNINPRSVTWSGRNEIYQQNSTTYSIWSSILIGIRGVCASSKAKVGSYYTYHASFILNMKMILSGNVLTKLFIFR